MPFVKGYPVSKHFFEILLAVAILVLILYPFPNGSYSQYVGVDEDLWAAFDYGGIISAKDNMLNITALPNSHPTVHVATSALPYTLEFDAAVQQYDLNESCFIRIPTDNASRWHLLSGSGEAFFAANESVLELSVNPAVANEKKVQLAYDFGPEGVDLAQTWMWFLTYSNYTGYPFNVGVFDADGNWAVWGIWHWPSSTWLEYKFSLDELQAKSEPSPDMAKIRYFFFETVPFANLRPANFRFSNMWVGLEDTSQPIRVDVWDTPTRSNVTVRYTPMGTVELLDLSNAVPVQEVTTYSLGQFYHFKIETSTNAPVILEMSNSTWQYTFTASKVFPYYAALTVSSQATVSTSSSLLRNFEVTFPAHGQNPFNPFWSYVKNPNVMNFVYLAFILLVIHLYGIAFRPTMTRTWTAMKQVASKARGNSRQLAVSIMLFIVVFIMYAALFPLGNHPFDWYAQRMYAYVSGTYGLSSIYSMSHVLSTAVPWGGQPPHHVGFPYGPLFADYYWLTGSTYLSLGFPANFAAFSFEFFFKTTQVLFTFASGCLIFFMSKRVGGSFRRSVLIMLLYVLNPAVLFDVAIWAIADALLILVLLLAAVSLEFNKCSSTWIFIGLSFLTKTTALPVALFIGVFALKKFGIRRSFVGISRAVIVAFLVSVPLFFAGYSPSITYSVVVAKTLGLDTPWNAAVGSSATLDAFNLWSLSTYILGARGDARFTFILSPKLLLVGEVLFGVVVLGLLLKILMKRHVSQLGEVFPVLAAVALALPMLQVDKISRYALIAFPFLMLSWKNINSKLYYFLVSIFSFTTFVSLYGLFAIHPLRWPLAVAPQNFAPSANVFNAFIVQLFTNDTFITLSAIANLIGFFTLLITTLEVQEPFRKVAVRLKSKVGSR